MQQKARQIDALNLGICNTGKGLHDVYPLLFILC
jgi:hypothetical protein